MALFISTENQNLLYEMIHKTPEIHTVFSNIDEKNQWFRNIIETKYKELPPTINRESLKQINRQVLAQMVTTLRSLSIPRQIPIQNLLKREQPLEPKEYTSFFDIPKPKPIDFAEPLNDEIITNMDELIENQKKMRERELQEYAPPPPSQKGISIQILEDLPSLPALPVTAAVPTPQKTVKNVHFDTPIVTESLYDNAIEIAQMKTKIDEMDKKLNDILGMLASLTQPIAKSSGGEPLANPVSFLKQLISETSDV